MKELSFRPVHILDVLLDAIRPTRLDSEGFEDYEDYKIILQGIRNIPFIFCSAVRMMPVHPSGYYVPQP
jgi:hypothetical protein